MATVHTVTGPIDDSEIGLTLIHEHLRFRDEAVAANWPGRYDEGEEHRLAVEEVRRAQEHGVRTIVEPTAMFGGRDVRFMARVAEETGMQVVACTGIYTYDFLPHYFENRDEDAIAEHFVRDLEEGVQGSGIRAAFLKCACDAPGMTPNVEKVHRAVARAHRQTGAPIMAHSHPGTQTGPKQIAIFEEEGVDLSRVQIAHCGDTDDVDHIEGLIARGVIAGLDRYGLEMYLPMERRNATAAELLRRGHADRLVLSQDFCVTIDWFPEAAAEQFAAAGMIRDWSFTLIFEQVIPALREQGMTEDQLHTMLVEVPRRWLAG